MKKSEQEDLFVTAIEGGSNYWLLLDIEGLKTERKKSEPLSEYLFRAAWNGEEVPVMDCEEPKERLGVITRRSFRRGLNLMKKEHRPHYDDAVSGDWDATTADVWLQLCVMGEVVFG